MKETTFPKRRQDAVAEEEPQPTQTGSRAPRQKAQPPQARLGFPCPSISTQSGPNSERKDG